MASTEWGAEPPRASGWRAGGRFEKQLTPSPAPFEASHALSGRAHQHMRVSLCGLTVTCFGWFLDAVCGGSLTCHDPHERGIAIGGAQRRSRFYILFLTVLHYVLFFQSRGPDPLRGGSGRAPTDPEIKNARPRRFSRSLDVLGESVGNWGRHGTSPVGHMVRDGGCVMPA